MMGMAVVPGATGAFAVAVINRLPVSSLLKLRPPASAGGIRAPSFPSSPRLTKLRRGSGGPLPGGLFLLPLDFKGLFELGSVHNVLGPASGQLRGEEVFQVEEVCRRAANIQSPTVLPTPFELKTRDAFKYVDSVWYHSDDEEVFLPGQRLFGHAEQRCPEVFQSGVDSPSSD
jgi:hypothetical protein